MDAAEIGGVQAGRELEHGGCDGDVAAGADSQDPNGEHERLQEGQGDRGRILHLKKNRAERVEDVRRNDRGR